MLLRNSMMVIYRMTVDRISVTMVTRWVDLRKWRILRMDCKLDTGTGAGYHPDGNIFLEKFFKLDARCAYY